MKRFVYLICLITLLAMSVSAHVLPPESNWRTPSTAPVDDARFECDLGVLYPTISLDLTTRINLQTPRRYACPPKHAVRRRAVSRHHRFVPWNRYLYCRNDPNFKKAVRAVITAMLLNKKRVADRREAGCLAVKSKSGGVEMTKIKVGSPIKVNLGTVYKQNDGTVKTIDGKEVEASLHGHVGNGKVDGVELESWKASPEDKQWSNSTGLDSYIVVKDDYLMLYEPGGEKAKRVLTGSDFAEYVDDNQEQTPGTE